MKKLFVVLPFIAVVAACSSVNNNYDRRAEAERERKEKSGKITIDEAPKWMSAIPKSENAIFAPGTAESDDYAMSVSKAKLTAYESICMGANGSVDMDKRNFKSDVGGQTIERAEVAIRAVCSKTNVRGVEPAQIDGEKTVKTVFLPNGKYRTYILIALPLGAANTIQTEFDRRDLTNGTAERAEKRFKDMNSN
jgi:cell division protein FtsL